MGNGNDEATLFVRGLSDGASEDFLRQIFEATGGTVTNISLPKDHETGRPRGFAFVTFATPEQAQAAQSNLDGSLQMGRPISVRKAEPRGARPQGGPGGPGGGFGGPRAGGPGGGGGFGGGAPRGPRPQDAPDRTLYVGNLPYDCTVAEVEAIVNNAAGGPGHVVNVNLPSDPDGRRRGFGFVKMDSAEVAKTAADALRQADLRGRPLRVNLANPPGERPPRPAGGFGGGGGFGGPPGGGGGFRDFGPPGGGFGPPPAPSRKFDDRKRKQNSSSNEDGPRKRRFEREERGGGGRGDWRDNDDD